MRYVVTGAAGFIGSNLADALAGGGARRRRRRLLHRLLRPGGEGGERARASTCGGSTSPRTTLDLDGVDGVFHLAAQAGVRSFGDVFPLYVRRNLLATQRVLEACAHAGVRVVFASSSSVYGEAEAYPTPEDATPRPISPYGITKLGCEHLARAYAIGFGLDAVVLRYFTVYGPRQRPDMFFRRVCEALLAGGRSRSTAPASSRAASRTSATRSPQRSRRWSERRRGAVYNVGGGEEASMLEAIALLERISGRTLDVAPRRRCEGRRPAHERRRRRASAKRSAGSPRRASRTAWPGCGHGPPARVAAG